MSKQRALVLLRAGRLVVGCVTTSESQLLYVFVFVSERALVFQGSTGNQVHLSLEASWKKTFRTTTYFTVKIARLRWPDS